MNEKNCFGIYQFDDDRISLFENIIKPIVEAHSSLIYEDARSKYESSNAKISTIYGLIKSAELCIIDLTYKNINVFFEYGIVFSEKIKFITICSKSNYSSKSNSGYSNKFPFDIEGKEVILYQNENNLRIRFIDALYDVLYSQNIKIMDWYSMSATNNVINPHQLIFNDYDKIISSSQLISNKFRLSFKINITEYPENKHPDFRVYISKNNEIHKSILIILPWENKGSNSEYECHVDYQDNPEDSTAIRLQQVLVNKKSSEKINEFSVFISLTIRGLIVESDFFDKDIPRILVTSKQLSDNGFDMTTSNYILFSSKCKCKVDQILIKEICQ
jgi:hypothetical protein